MFPWHVSCTELNAHVLFFLCISITSLSLPLIQKEKFLVSVDRGSNCYPKHMSHVMVWPAFCLSEKTKAQIKCVITGSAPLFSLLFYLYFQKPKFQISERLLWLYSPVFVGNLKDKFSHDATLIFLWRTNKIIAILSNKSNNIHPYLAFCSLHFTS